MRPESSRQRRETSRFPGLSVISTALKVLAYIVAIIGIITAIAIPFTTAAPFLAELGLIVGVLLAAFIQAIIYYALGDYLQVIMDIEYNTFNTNRMLQQQTTTAEQKRIA
jgi:hypothetical protein